MGFGVMFLGSVFLLNANIFGIDVIVDFIGFFIIFKGLSIANRYTDKFKTVRKVSFAAIFVSSSHFVFSLINAFTENIIPELAVQIAYWAYTMFMFTFYISFLQSIVGITREVDLPKYGLRAYTGMVFAVILFLGGRFLEKAGGTLTSDPGLNNVLGIAGYVIENIFVIYILVLVFNCYMFICLEGDEDMPDNRKNKKIPSPIDVYERGEKKYGKNKR